MVDEKIGEYVMIRYVLCVRSVFWGMCVLLFAVSVSLHSWGLFFLGVGCVYAIMYYFLVECIRFQVKGFDGALFRHAIFGNYGLFGIEKTVIGLCLCDKVLFDRIVWKGEYHISAYIGRFILDVVETNLELCVYYDGKIICQRKLNVVFRNRLFDDFRSFMKKDDRQTEPTTDNSRLYYDELKRCIESKKSLDMTD